MKDRARKPGRGEASYGGEERRKKDRDTKPTGGSKNPFGDIGKPIGGMGKSTDSDDNIFNDIGKLSGGKKSKDGCFPKLFMLLLSIMTGIVYFFLNS